MYAIAFVSSEMHYNIVFHCLSPTAPTPWGTGAHSPPSPLTFYKWLGTEGIVSRKKANDKLTRLY